MQIWPGERGRRLRLRSGIARQQEEMRVAGQAAFVAPDGDVDVLDLTFDSMVDSPAGPADNVRRLRFVGRGCTVEVDVHGIQRLTVELRVSPTGPVVVESRTPGGHDAGTVLWPAGRSTTWLRPQVTSFLLRWPDSARRPARTAWVRL